MITWAAARLERIACCTAAGSSLTMARSLISWPLVASRPAIASPLESLASVRVSLMVRTTHRTDDGAFLRCSSVDTQ
jgi:hypothetical protein